MSLSEFTEKLVANDYKSLERLRSDVYDQVEKIRKLESHHMDQAYLKQCHNVLDNIGRSLSERSERSIPYLRDLAEKAAADHNCTNCAGGCKLKHDTRLSDLSAAAKDLKKIQGELQLLSLPTYSETRFPEQYRVLRNLLALLESEIVELFFLEENQLIPKVIEAQKAINVSGK